MASASPEEGSPPIATNERRFERLRLLTEVSRALTYTTSIDEVLRLAVRRAAELVSAEKSLIMLTDDDGLLAVRETWGIEEERVTEFRAPLSETLVTRLQGMLDYPSEACFVSVPLVAQGEVAGLLAAVRPVGGEASEDDEWLLSALADQAAVALENARLTEAVTREKAERGRAAEAHGRAHATLGHELRSPLTAIQAYSAMLLEGMMDPLTDRQRESVKRIQMSGDHLLAVIENVLDLARINAGAMKLTATDVAVSKALAEALQMVQPVALRKDQEIRTRYPDGLVVRADPHRLRQALVNLIGNAIKYTPERGTIGIDVSTREVDGASCAAIAITDNGRGIPSSALPNLFEPYERAGGGEYESGLGLGLFISRELVRAMGGDIRVESEPGVGSTFTVSLPLVRQEEGS